MLLLQRLQFYLAANCHQAKAKLARDAAPLQLRYPDLKECEALARLGLRYTDTVRGRLGYVLFDISVIYHIACVHCVRALHGWDSPTVLFTNSLKLRNHARLELTHSLNRRITKFMRQRVM